MSSGSTGGRRAAAFIAICVISAVAIGLYVTFARRATEVVSGATPAASTDPETIRSIASEPHLLFRSTTLDRGYGQVALVPLDALDTPPAFTSLTCERVHFAAGRGVCLTADRGMTTSYRLELFDEQYQTDHTVPLAGMPSRARVAERGGMAALTYFVSGDSYAATSFSTRTFLIDLQKGNDMANLESFTVTRDGAAFKSVDFNFWGVTFAHGAGKFYATLSSAGTMYLVEGDANTQTARVLRDGVECPSLSPDNRRIAFKRRQPGFTASWRIVVLDLASGAEVALPETRSVDDQVEWLDDQTIIYALPEGTQASAAMNLWAAAADGQSPPRLLLSNAESPAVVRSGR
jgi:hypothetical protein